MYEGPLKISLTVWRCCKRILCYIVFFVVNGDFGFWDQQVTRFNFYLQNELWKFEGTICCDIRLFEMNITAVVS